MKNPLRRRILRELRQEFPKYLVIFLLMSLSIGFISGFLVADNSMLSAYWNSFEKYHVEDGHFRTPKAMNKAQKKRVNQLGITLYDQFYTDQAMDNETTLRIFAPRDTVNLVCLMGGRLPEETGEIILDRLYARNNQIAVGDTITAGPRAWTVVGIAALSDYSTLFSDNNDTMFDSIRFGVGVVSREEFSLFRDSELMYSYAFTYENPPADEAAEKDRAEDLLKDLTQEIKLKSFVPRFQNQAITFTGEDMGSDKAMMIILLYMIIAILAFVFAVTTSNTITKEATVIGTLRASGYTRGELIRHYMASPLLVTLISAVTGNILGYTVFRKVCEWMYYNSYSLPTYTVLWNGEAFMETTLVPMFLMALINFLILRRALALSPLKFIRRDLTRKKQRRAMKLPYIIPFFSRFRFRVVLQNLPNYLTLFVGIAFANLLLMFGLGLPMVLDNFQESITTHLLSNYQVMLTLPMDTVNEEHKLETLFSMMQFSAGTETENETAEKFNIHALDTTYEQYKAEEITIYGIEEGSRYVPVDVSGGRVYASSAFADKYYLKPGDTVTLREKYEDDIYSFTIDGVFDYIGGLDLFMSREVFNQTFDEDEDAFAGYFSDTPITDIDEEYVGTVIDVEDLTKVSRQLQVSMGGMMSLVNVFAVVIFIVLMYLLSKIIIEKNAQSIS
ncbi:MAG: ABC transporter permease, partial [Lachnospiraceae bacterium]|nr:ABC transporter permease [Lachnospiraceae bacterium]